MRKTRTIFAAVLTPLLHKRCDFRPRRKDELADGLQGSLEIMSLAFNTRTVKFGSMQVRSATSRC
jgi:hypothetical protein